MDKVQVVGVISRAYTAEFVAECDGAQEFGDKLNLASYLYPVGQ